MKPVKLPISQIKTMSAEQIAYYLMEITQTEICRDEKYCKALCEIFIKAK